MPTSSRPTVLLAPIGRDDHTSPPGIALQLMKKPCHCEGAPRPWRSVPPALRFLCLRRLPFFLRQKKGRKERRQNQGFGILFAAEVSTTSVSSYLADRDVQNLHLAFAWPLRHHPLAAHAGPRCPDAAGIHFASAVLCATFLVIVSQGTMPTSSRPTVLLAPIGRDDHTSPPGIALQLMKKPCHCEGAPRPWRSVPPALRFLCLRRLPFFLRQKKGRKERRQNQGFGILFAAGVSSTSVSSYLADRDAHNLHLAFAWSLRRHPLAAHAGPRCPDASGKHFASAALCVTFLVIVS